MFKGMKKGIQVAAAAMLAGCMLLAGCGEKLVPADQTVGALFELSAKDNAAPMKDLLGFASEDDVRSSFIEDGANIEAVDMLKEEFTSAGVEFSEEELQNMTDSIMGMLNKITYTSEITSEDKDKITVTLKVNGYSVTEMGEIMLEVSENALNSLSEEDQMKAAEGDEEVTMAFVQQYVKDFLAALTAMEPSAEPTVITVECEKLKVEVSGKIKVAWLPSDMASFESDIENSLFKE